MVAQILNPCPWEDDTGSHWIEATGLREPQLSLDFLVNPCLKYEGKKKEPNKQTLHSSERGMAAQAMVNK